MNAFSSRLGEFKFNVFDTFVVDLLHEVELGVWKSVLKHHIRVLHLSGSTAVTEFNKRFRMVPTFSDSIRMFSDDVAGLSRLAARDFEDILQCCIPVFEGLIPESCAESSQTLLFVLAQWHGLAKLRLHTSETLKVLKRLTIQLGSEFRRFAELTQDMDVRETPKEYLQRRKRAETRAASMLKAQAQSKGKSQRPVSLSDGRRHCELNLNTHKVHALADYVDQIEEFGTTDSYSTQIPELQHRKVKMQFERTNKQPDSVSQMTNINDICETLQDMEGELAQRQSKLSVTSTPDPIGIQALLNGSKYSIGQTDRYEDRISNISQWVYEQHNDDAMKFFVPQLKRHLLSRFLGGYDHSSCNEGEMSQIRIYRDIMYRHKTLRINYTSYDVQRQQDLLNPNTPSRFILLPSNDDSYEGAARHPFLYAKVLGVYHAEVSYRQHAPRRMDFVHVRWLYYDYECPGGWDIFRLDCVGYKPCCSDEDNLDSFDFVDPNDIIRTAHLIPDFQTGTTDTLLNTSHSLSHDDPQCGVDWRYFYVNRFVDRDVLMRYLSGGVGHYRCDVAIPEGSAIDMDQPDTTRETALAADDQHLGANELEERSNTENLDDYDEEGNNEMDIEDVVGIIEAFDKDEGEEEDGEEVDEDEENRSDSDNNDSFASDVDGNSYEY
ncbi:hypothetical protein OPQ81_004992 [Rhizoctonia solani]|nr:hypothetical protein OPQ81_004992 [Rhizoctonia solani]